MGEGSHYISVGSEQLHYLEWGSGMQLLLAFHGYGNDAKVFNPFREHLACAYTVLSFDLPHHGASKWPDNTPLKKEALLALIKTLMGRYNVDKVSLVGYSMGGRVCMTIVEYMPEHIDKVVLLATDGLVVNKLYYFCTRTFFGKNLFRHVLDKPGAWIRLMDWLKKSKLLDPSRHKFVMQHLQSAERRKFLLQVWPSVSEFIPDPAKLKREIKKYRIKIYIFMGIHDRIMPPKLGELFKEGLDTVQVFTSDKGHRVFDDTNAKDIAQHLL